MSRREKFSKLSCVIEFFKIEQGLLQLINSRRREDARSQQTKLLQHLCPRHGMLVASPGMENFPAIDLSIQELHVQLHSMASLVAERLELRLSENFHLSSCFQTSLPANPCFRALIHAA